MSEDNKLRVVMVEPGKPAYETEIENTLEAEQKAVGGYIEVVPLDNERLLICNEEGMLMELPYNCNICGVDFVGTIVIAGINGDEFSDIPLSFEEFKESFDFLEEAYET